MKPTTQEEQKVWDEYCMKWEHPHLVSTPPIREWLIGHRDTTLYRNHHRKKTMLDLTKPVQYKDGRAVTILTSTRPNPLPIIAMNDKGDLSFHDIEGFSSWYDPEDKWRLINVPPPKVVVSTTVYLWRSCTGKIFITHSPDIRYDKMSQGKSTLLGSKLVTIEESEASQGA